MHNNYLINNFMPIKSYLAYPQAGKKKELIETLTLFKDCEVIPAENKEILVIVTETQDANQEDKIKDKIEALDSLKLLTLVSGFNIPQND